MVNRIFDEENFLIGSLILKGRSNGKKKEMMESPKIFDKNIGFKTIKQIKY